MGLVVKETIMNHEQLFLSLASPSANQNNTIWDFTKTQNDILTATKASVAAISIAFSLCFLVYVYLRSTIGLLSFFVNNRKLRGQNGTVGVYDNETWKQYFSRMQYSCYILSNPITRVLVCVQLAELMDDAQVMIEVFDLAQYDWVCTLQAIMFQYFGFAKITWGFMVSIWMIWILVLRKTSTLLILEIISHIIGWGLPIIVTIVPIFTDSYGDLGRFCWIKGDRVGTWLRFALNYIPLWVIISAVVLMYIFTISCLVRIQYFSYRSLTSTARRDKLSASLSLYMKLLGLPLIFVLLWVFPTVTRIVETATGRKYFVLFFMMNLTRYGHGFCNTLLLVFCALVTSILEKMKRGRRKEFVDATELGDKRTINDDDMYDQFLGTEFEFNEDEYQ